MPGARATCQERAQSPKRAYHSWPGAHATSTTPMLRQVFMECQKATPKKEALVVCTQCAEELPRNAFDLRSQGHLFERCRNCIDATIGKCYKCSKPRKKTAGESQAQSKGFYFCSDFCRFPPCAARGCKERRPQRADYAFDKVTEWHCKKHRH